MSVSVGWKKIDPRELEYIEGTSRFVDILEKAFGELPIKLYTEDIDKLEGIAACGEIGAKQLVSAILQCEQGIVVEAQW